MKDFAFLFPGQGSQTVGMGKDLSEKSDFGKKTFKMTDEILGYSLSKICFTGPEEKLRLTSNVQPALLTVSYILYHLLGKEPLIAAGHSLGEYSALVGAGSIKYEDAVLLVHKRGKYMQEAVPVDRGAMAAVMGADFEQIKDVVSGIEGVDIANRNGSTQVVISGEKNAVEEAVEKITAKKTKFLPVSAPFHSQLMKPAKEKLSHDLDNTEFKDLNYPVVNNIAAVEMRKGADAREALKKQVTGTVLWHDTMVKFLQEKEILKFAEIGPGKVLSGLARRTGRDLGFEPEITTMQNLDDLEGFLKG